MEPDYKRSATPFEILNEYMKKIEEEYMKSKIKSIVKLLPNSFKHKKILDLGCGGGYYSLSVASKGATDIIALDINELFVKTTSLNLRINTNIEAKGVRGDCTHLPFQKEVLDFIICVNVIERINNVNLFLEEISRVLKRRGLLIITARNPNTLNNFFVSTHQIRLYPPQLFLKKLNRFGFKVKKYSGYYIIPYVGIGNKFDQKTILNHIMKSFFRNINDLFEELGNKAPFYKFNWENAYLCIKSTSTKKSI